MTVTTNKRISGNLDGVMSLEGDGSLQLGGETLTSAQRASVRAGIGAAAISDTAEQLFSLSYPMILAPSGSFSSTDGQFILGTALPAIPNGTVGDGGSAKIYLPAGAGGLAAGWHSATFSSTTVGQLVGAPVTTASAWTQSTSQVTAISVLIPGDSALSTGSVEIETATSNNGGAGVKSVRYGIDSASGVYVFQNTTALSTRGLVKVKNRGAKNKNVVTNNAGQFSGTSAACQTTSFDFSADRTLQVALQINTATDYNILELLDIVVTKGQ